MNFLFVGDSHGDDRFLESAINHAAKNSVDKIIQVGDFGYWEHTTWGVEFLDRLNTMLEQADMDIYWIDGNHENHPLLRSRYDIDNGPVNIRSRIIYLPRGTHWDWDGIHFLAVGGAYSIDAPYRQRKFREKIRHIPTHKSRKKYETWWAEETITDEEVQTAIQNTLDSPVDVLVAHDVPSFVNLDTEFAVRSLPFFTDEPGTESNRSQLQRIVDLFQPGLIVHGHYHLRYSQTARYPSGKECQVEGIACNNNQYGQRPWSWKSHAFKILSTKDIKGQ